MNNKDKSIRAWFYLGFSILILVVALNIAPDFTKAVLLVIGAISGVLILATIFFMGLEDDH